MAGRFALELDDGVERLRACEPTRGEVAMAAPQLAAFYNQPHNQAMLSHDETLSVDDVVADYRALAAEGAHAFLLEHAGVLVGDADLRHIESGHAEVAILVGERSV